MIWLLALLQQVSFPQGVDVDTYPKIYSCEIRTLVQIYDADTITKPDCYLGMGVTLRVDPGIRSHGIDATEVRGEQKEAGLVCRDALRAAIRANDLKFTFVAHTDSKGREVKDKWGRTVGHILVDGKNMAIEAMQTGCAVQREY